MTADGKSVNLISGNGLYDGQWHFVTAAWDANGNDTLYVDGTVVASGNNRVDNVGISDTAYIGKSVADSDFFQGSMKDVTLYNYAISPCQAADTTSSKH